MIDCKLYQVIYKFNKKITSMKFNSVHLNKIHLFCDRNVRTYKILFADNDTLYLDKIHIQI